MNANNTVAEYVKSLSYGESSGHDWWHVKRVHDMALHIAAEEEKEQSVNRELVEPIAYLHDVFDEKLSDTKPEDGLSVLISELGLNLSAADKENLIHSISNLSFSHSLEGKNEPLSIEGQIVQDADRLDAIGAIGIARCFAYGGSHGREIYDPDQGIQKVKTEKEYHSGARHSINHFYEKLLKLEKLMNTDTGRKIAAERTAFMKEYLAEFFAEWEGCK